MVVDLGGIGKGYAIDQAVESLRENGVRSGLLHGGTSTVYAIGVPPGQDGWQMSLTDGVAGYPDAAGRLAPVTLQDGALAVSSPSEKSFRVDRTTYGHVIDPRTGWPTRGASLAVVALPVAADADAWSTALLVLGPAGLKLLEQGAAGGRGLVLGEAGVCGGVWGNWRGDGASDDTVRI
jgi:thiamine biosynthesis lipoprotein